MFKHAYASSFTGRPLTSGAIQLIGVDARAARRKKRPGSSTASRPFQEHSLLTTQRKAVIEAQRAERWRRRQRNDVLGDYLTTQVRFRPFQALDTFEGPLSIYTAPDRSVERLRKTSQRVGEELLLAPRERPRCNLDKLTTMRDLLLASKQKWKPDLSSEQDLLEDLFPRRSTPNGSRGGSQGGSRKDSRQSEKATPSGFSKFWRKPTKEEMAAQRNRERSSRRNAVRYDKNVERLINCSKLGKLYDIKRMIDEGKVKNIDAYGKDGLTALHTAAVSLNVRVMEYLIKKGASPMKKDIIGRDIRTLIESGTAANDITHENHNRWLLDRALIVVSPQSIFSAAQSGDEERLRWLIESGLHNSNDTNKHCMTALHYAMMNDHKACTMLLLDAGADPYVENTLGQTPLQLATPRLASLVRQRLEKDGEVIAWSPLNA